MSSRNTGNIVIVNFGQIQLPFFTVNLMRYLKKKQKNNADQHKNMYCVSSP